MPFSAVYKENIIGIPLSVWKELFNILEIVYQ